MASGYIRISKIADEFDFTVDAEFVFELVLSECDNFAITRLINRSTNLTRKIPKSEFLQIIKNISDVFTITQDQTTKVYPGPDLTVEFENCKTCLHFNDVATTHKRLFTQIASADDIAVFNSVTSYLITVMQNIFYGKPIGACCNR